MDLQRTPAPKKTIKEKLTKFTGSIKKIPEKKNHLDFIAALLTIPVLISVIILNYNNLQSISKNKAATPTPTVTQAAQQYLIVPSGQKQTTPSPTSATCIKDIGPISISSPSEGDTVSDNPLCININYSNSNYCSVVWSYRINGGAWSDYTSNNPCIYNLPNGNVKFDLRVQSTVNQSQTSITRNFIYKGQPISTPSPASSSATLN